MHPQERRHIAIGLLLIGLLCVGIGVITALHAQAEKRRLELRRTPPPAPTTQLQDKRLDLARHWVLAAGAILGVFLIATLAMSRFRQRLLALLTKKPSPPTDAEDVWLMHKLPEEEEGPADEPGSER